MIIREESTKGSKAPEELKNENEWRRKRIIFKKKRRRRMMKKKNNNNYINNKIEETDPPTTTPHHNNRLNNNSNITEKMLSSFFYYYLLGIIKIMMGKKVIRSKNQFWKFNIETDCSENVKKTCIIFGIRFTTS